MTLYTVLFQCSLVSASNVNHSQYLRATMQQETAASQSDVDKSSLASELSVLRKTVDELTSTVQSYKLTDDKLSNQLILLTRI